MSRRIPCRVFAWKPFVPEWVFEPLTVTEDLCAGYQYCLSGCPFGAPEFPDSGDGTAHIFGAPDVEARSNYRDETLTSVATVFIVAMIGGFVCKSGPNAVAATSRRGGE